MLNCHVWHDCDNYSSSTEMSIKYGALAFV